VRTFSQQPEATDEALPAESTTPSRVPQRSREADWMLYLQRTMGNRATQRLASRLSPTACTGAAVIRPKLKVGEPNDKFEREADRVADKVMNMPEAPPRADAISSSAVIQRNETNDRISRKEVDKKAELEFTSSVAFNSSRSGFNPTGPPQEREDFFIRWGVRNTGWEHAPPHTNYLTIYDTTRCAGCRNDDDVVYRTLMSQPSIAPITRPVEGDIEYETVFPVWGLGAGRYEAVAKIDVDDEVEEINESNNTNFFDFIIKPRNEPEEEEEETVQRKEAGPAPAAGPGVASQISGLRGGGQPLPQSLREFFEPRFGYDFSRVRIHADARAAETARQLQAKAFTVGHDVVFGEGQSAVEKTEGRHLLAHELAHVVQQTSPTPFDELRPAPSPSSLPAHEPDASSYL
jgi:hypothetical protein